MASEPSDQRGLDAPTERKRDLEVTLQAAPAGVVLQVAGEVDLHSVDLLRTYLDDAFADTVASVVVDLARVSFLDSSGLAALAKARSRLAAASRSFAVQNPTPTVRRTLTITGLDDLISDAVA